jgi:hypothetical protein
MKVHGRSVPARCFEIFSSNSLSWRVGGQVVCDKGFDTVENVGGIRFTVEPGFPRSLFLKNQQFA